MHYLSGKKLHVKPLNCELIPPICYNFVFVQISILLIIARAIFWGKTQSLSYHSSSTSMASFALRLKSQILTVVMKPCTAWPLPLHKAHPALCPSPCYAQHNPLATLASFQLPECVNPSEVCSLSRNLSSLFLVSLAKNSVLQISV